MSFENWCKHYTGLTHDTCEAGVLYKDVKDPSDKPLGYPCFKDKGCTHLCSQAVFLTEEEIAEKKKDIQKSLERFLENLANDICPHCEKLIQEKKQIGRCVYGYPCGHRLYQGTLPKKGV